MKFPIVYEKHMRFISIALVLSQILIIYNRYNFKALLVRESHIPLFWNTPCVYRTALTIFVWSNLSIVVFYSWVLCIVLCYLFSSILIFPSYDAKRILIKYMFRRKWPGANAKRYDCYLILHMRPNYFLEKQSEKLPF